MLVDGGIVTANPLEGAAQGLSLEQAGYAGGFSFDGRHDPFLPLMAAASSTQSLQLSTAIAVAFARTPYLLAQQAWDLQLASQGRFSLGLGSQIKPHIERRFSMPWGAPAARMKEFVQVVRSIWDCWQDGRDANFRGQFYQHTLMPPLLNPGPNPWGRPPILLAGVGESMTRVAGEVADGLIVHPLNSRTTLQQVTLPALLQGRACRGVGLDGFSIRCQIMVATGETDELIHQAREAVRGQIAFYASTPAYKVMLDCHGWGHLQPQLQQMTRDQRWDKLPSLVSDDMLDTFAVTGSAAEVARSIQAKIGDVTNRVSLVAPYAAGAERFAGIVALLQTTQ